jgi:transcriptional regulator with GAF, ATPase, and Fis domain
MANSTNGNKAIEKADIMAERLQTLLQIAEAIFGVLDLDSLLPTIMDKACALLNTERCSLFIVDRHTNELVTRFHGGLNEAIRVKMGVGIAGYTAETGECVNINDAYSDPRFDKTFDMSTGFKTKTLLTVPIYDNRGAIAGVTEMINRKDGKCFDQSDIQLMKTFNVYCGISLDNANLYNTSLQLMKQIHGFVETSAIIGKVESIDKVLMEIIETMKSIVNGEFAAVFSYDNETETIDKLASTGHPLDSDTSYVKMSIKAREFKAFSIDQKTTPDKKHKHKPRTFSLTPKFDKVELSDSVDKESYVKKIVCFPLLASDNQMLGAVEVGTNNIILTEDVKLLSCFSVFAALSLEKERLKKVTSIGESEVRIKSYIKDDEEGVGDIPIFLRIEKSKQSTIFAINFDAPHWDGVGHFRVLFHIMDEFKLLQTLKIRNETFLRFLCEVSQSYKKVPYHNWRHAVDVTQFVAYQVKLTKLDLSLTKIQLFCLFVAAILHDVNHDGFTNVFNEKAETPLGILFKNQSVMETHHCQVAINITTKEECNIFANFNSHVYKACWQIIIDLILATDMAKHHSTLQAANQRLDEGPLDLHNDNNKIMVMQLFLKCGDISNVSRPFEFADKWCDVLCDEFFRQGDLEKTSGMEYTSPLNDRAHLDKPKSQIGFYTFVCLPLFQTVARAFPELQVNVDQINSNLAVWKSRTEVSQ